MPKKSSKKKMHGQPSDPAARVRWLLTEIWRGNCSMMARDINMSHAAIGRVVRGERPPGRELLTAIANQPKVNATWLLTGEGEPLVAEQAQLPVARTLLPGPPDNWSDLLSGEHFPMAVSFALPSRYLYEVPAGHPIVHHGPKVESHDLLLLETDRTLCKNPQAVDNRTCVIRDPDAHNRRVVLAHVTFDPGHGEGPDELNADIYDEQLPLPTPARSVRDSVIGELGDEWEIVARPKKPSSPRESAKRRMEPMGSSRCLKPADIVAVCVQLIRR